MIRTRQPQGAARIDWSNPLARGLQFVQSGKFDPPWVGSGVGLEPTPYGLAAKFVRASSQYATTSIPSLAAAPLTIACRYKLASTPTNSTAYLLLNLSRADNTALCELYVTRDVSSTDRVMALSYNAGTSAQATVITTHDATNFVNTAGVWSLSNRRAVYYNGVFGADETTTVNITNPLTNAYLGVETLAGTRSAGTYFDGVIPVSAVWNRALSKQELDRFLLTRGSCSPRPAACGCSLGRRQGAVP
jgi:hypothetical protein